MKNALRVPVVTVLLSAALLATGCFTDEREQAVAFNEGITEATTMVETPDLEFQQSLLPVLRGEKVDVGAIEGALQTVKRGIEEAHKRLEAASMPDTTSARALAKAHAAFLDHQEKALSTDFAAAVAAVKAKDLTTEARVARVREVFIHLQDSEYDDFAALRKAQADFAAEHHLILTDSDQNTPLPFLTALGVINGRLEMGGKQLAEALNAELKEMPPKGDRVTACLAAARQMLAASQRMAEQLKAPSGKAARELAAAEKAYLKKQSDIFDEYFPKLTQLANDPVLVPESRKERLDEVLKLMNVAESATMLRLTAARDEFLRENRLIAK